MGMELLLGGGLSSCYGLDKLVKAHNTAHLRATWSSLYCVPHLGHRPAMTVLTARGLARNMFLLLSFNQGFFLKV